MHILFVPKQYELSDSKQFFHLFKLSAEWIEYFMFRRRLETDSINMAICAYTSDRYSSGDRLVHPFYLKNEYQLKLPHIWWKTNVCSATINQIDNFDRSNWRFQFGFNPLFVIKWSNNNALHLIIFWFDSRDLIDLNFAHGSHSFIIIIWSQSNSYYAC